MFLMLNLDAAATNLLSIPVLAFALGLLAARLRSDLSVSKGLTDGISFVLLLAIGFKGGAAIYGVSIGELAIPLTMTIVLGCVIPLIAFALLGLGKKKISKVDRGSIAAHYGSTSLVTFSAALVFLETQNITYEGKVTALLVAMEIPGILVGILLAKGGFSALKNKELIREVFLGKSVLLLLGGLLIGAIAGPTGVEKVSPLFVDALPGLLTLFLLTLGFKTGGHLGEFKALGFKMLAFGTLFPLFTGAAGALTATLIGMSPGGATAFAVLCASASYIAAPAAVSVALPEASKPLTILSSLGVTFPFNLIVGIPVYFMMANAFAAWL